MNKEQVKQLVNEKVAEILAAVDSLEEGSGSNSEEVESLRQQLQVANEQLQAKDAKISELEATLKEVDARAKGIDALIPDAPAEEVPAQPAE